MQQPVTTLGALIKRLVSPILAFGCSVWLAGCATPADPGHMSVTTLAPTASPIPFPAALQHAMCVRSVTGGEATNPLWVSKVSSQDFQTALTASIEGAGLLAPPGGCHYMIDANLLGLSQPAFGLALEVTSHINYKVFNTSDQPIVLETVSAPYTATFADSPVAFIRLKRANEGSVRANISGFLDKLRATPSI